jgi:hypothetical protein
LPIDTVRGMLSRWDPTPDEVFPTATASTSPIVNAATENPKRHVLPKNLRNAVKHLSDAELDLMHAAMSLAILEQQYSH